MPTAPLLFAPGASPASICSADFNRDGHPDLAVGAGVDGIAVFLGVGDGSFRRQANVNLAPDRDFLVRSADLDGDGGTDLVVLSNGPEIFTLRNLGNGTFRETFGLRPPVQVWSFALADFDGDQRIDFATPNSGGNFYWMARGRGDLGFDPPPPMPGNKVPGAIVAGDFNGDGRPDLAVSRLYEDSVAVTLGTASGNMVDVISPLTVKGPSAMATGDFNRDGHLDLAVANPYQDTISILLGRGDGRFLPPIEWSVGNLPTAILAGDLNGDGRADLVVGNWQGPDLSLLLGRGDGSFLPPSPIPAGLHCSDLVLADFNHDGRPDLASAHRSSGAIHILLNQPSTNEVKVQETRRPRAYHPRKSSRRDYIVTSWTTEQGLPQNSVHGILQTRDGFLWVGTQHGLARFDGREFRVFNESSDPPLVRSHCRSLAEDDAGNLWIGTAQGLVCFRQGEFENLPVQAEADFSYVQSIIPDADDKLWFLEGSRRRLLVHGAPAPCDALGAWKNTAMMRDEAGGLWGNGETGLWHQPAGTQRVELLYPNRNLVSFERGGKGLLQDRSGRIWFSNFNDLGIWDLGHVQFVKANEGGWPVHPMTAALAEDASGNIWAGFDPGGLYRIREGQVESFSIREGLSDDAVQCIHADHDGNLWAGTRKGGLNRLQPRRLVTYGAEEGLVHEDVWSISEAPDGSVWMATDGGASRLANGEFTHFPMKSGNPPDSRTRAILAASDGRVWARTSEQLAFVDGDHLSALESRPHRLLPETTSMNRADDGTTWFTAVHLLASYREGTWAFRDVGTTPTNYPNLLGVFPISSNELWVGSSGSGAFHLEGTRETRITRENGLTSDLVAPVLRETNGVVWFASNAGLNRWDRGRITAYTPAQGLPEGVVLDVLDDGLGWFWLNGHRGIHRIAKADLEAVAAGRLPKVESVTFGTADGMLSAEGNGGMLPNSCRTRDGRLWFPTARGAVVIDPQAVLAADHPPRVCIKQIRANGLVIRDQIHAPRGARRTNEILNARSSRGDRDLIVMGPGAARLLEIDFAEILGPAPEKARFRYRLEGKDPDWREAGEENRAIYSDLSPGQYCFRLKARTALGAWHPVRETVEFRLAPFYYETPWFHGLLLLIGAGGAFGFLGYRLSVQRRLLRLGHEAELAREQERISRDMHDDLGASLTRIALLGRMARSQIDSGVSPTAQVEEIADIASQAVDDMGEIIWANNPSYDTWESLVGYLREYASHSFAESGIECRQSYPGDLPDEPVQGQFRRHLLLILKEILTNIHKHAQAARVDVCFALASGQATLVVTDDGRGFDPSEVPPLHHGLANLRRRCEQLHGALRLTTAPGRGTRVEASIPLQHREPSVHH